jgi:hypothetical protein
VTTLNNNIISHGLDDAPSHFWTGYILILAFSGAKSLKLLDNSEYQLTYEDRDGDWMLVGDVPWE